MNAITSNYLSNDDLLTLTPSVFAEHAAEDVSDKYQFVKTIDVVEHLRSLDWLPVKAEQQRSMSEDNRNYTKHLLRFRHRSSEPVLNSTHFEVVLINSHNRSSAYQFHAGLFRLVCSNGLVVSDGTLNCIRVKHIGDLSEIQEATLEVINSLPKVAEKVREFNKIELTREQERAYAESALILRYDEGTKLPVSVDTLLGFRRSEDMGNDLWHTFNRVQENLTKGMKGRYTEYDRETGKKLRMTAVKSINENTKLNKALWALTEKMAELAKQS